jgi:hypothetical protein
MFPGILPKRSVGRILLIELHQYRVTLEGFPETYQVRSVGRNLPVEISR